MNKNILHRLLQPWVVITATAIIAVAAVAITYLIDASKPAAAYALPTQGAIVQTVSTTGTVTSSDNLDLSFQMSGQIGSVTAEVGEHVGAGQTLAVLDGADLAAQVQQAKAALQLQQANLEGLQAGATPESVAQAQTGVANAQSSILQAKQSVLQASQDAYLKSSNAIHNDVDLFINNPHSASPTLALTLSNSQLQSSIGSDRVAMETLLAQWQSYENSLPVDPSLIDANSVASTTRTYLQQVSNYLTEVSQGLAAAVPSTSYPAATIALYQGNVASGAVSVSADISALNTAQTAYQGALSGLASAQSALGVTQQPATPAALAAQEASIAAAQANVNLAQANLGKTVLFAPISGTITVNNAHVGETAAAGSPLISMVSDSLFQMDTYVSEADIAKVKVGDAAAVTLDAYQSDAPFPAHVIQIDPAATIQNGISSYKVTLQFDDNDPRVQSGMTGTALITTQTVPSGLSVPTSAIITNGTSTFVIIHRSSGDVQMPVVTGVESGQGTTQIISGVSPQDEVRTFGNQ